MQCYVPNVEGRSGKGRCILEEEPREGGYRGGICKRKIKQLGLNPHSKYLAHKVNTSLLCKIKGENNWNGFKRPTHE